MPTIVPVADHASQHLGGEPADHPPGQLLGTGDARREVDGVEPEAVAERVGGRALHRGPIDDPDLDDALRPGTLEQARDLRPGHAELFGDRVLRLTQLVVQAAGPDELRRSRSWPAVPRRRGTGAVGHPTAPRPGRRGDARLYCADVPARCRQHRGCPVRVSTASGRTIVAAEQTLCLGAFDGIERRPESERRLQESFAGCASPRTSSIAPSWKRRRASSAPSARAVRSLRRPRRTGRVGTVPRRPCRDRSSRVAPSSDACAWARSAVGRPAMVELEAKQRRS